jgi:hypothetical protein
MCEALTANAKKNDLSKLFYINYGIKKANEIELLLNFDCITRKLTLSASNAI